MKKIDKDGLLLCNLQGDIFLKSLEYVNTSSEIFMRRFMLSDIIKEFDNGAVLNDSITINEVFEMLNKEFGESNYGKVRYNKEVLFWIGYFYRYMAYTYNLSSRYIYKIIKPKELNELYYVYHTFDCAQAIERILEDKNISFDIDKQNDRLLRLMRKRKYEKEVSIVPENIGFDVNKADDMRMSFLNEDEYFDSINLFIVYREKIVGRVCFIKTGDYNLEIEITDDKYKNKGLGCVAILKAIDYLKSNYSAGSIVVRLLKSDSKSIHVFGKIGFSYFDEDVEYAYFRKQ